MRHCAILVITGFLLLSSAAMVAAGPHQAGIGLHYWFAIDEIENQDSFDEDGFNWLFSYKYQNSIIGFLGEVEMADREIAGNDDLVWSPQVFVTIGDFLYGGVGIGVHYTDSDFSDPFYALKVGLDMELIHDFLHLDVNANYRFDNWDYDAVREDVDTDTVTLGAVVRFEF